MLNRRSALRIGGGAAAMLTVPGLAIAQNSGLQAAEVMQLHALLNQYLWGLDTFDSARMAGVFAPDAVVRDAVGKSWNRRTGGIAAFVAEQANMPAGGQHYLQLNRVVRTGRRYRVESYWSRIEWRIGEPGPVLTALGSFTDTFVQHRGSWLIGERRIALWNSDTVTVPVVQETAA